MLHRKMLQLLVVASFNAAMPVTSIPFVKILQRHMGNARGRASQLSDALSLCNNYG
jgi:hypothetical protein